MNLFICYGRVLTSLFWGNLMFIYFVSYMIKHSNCFIVPPNPLKQLLFSRAVVSSVTEQLDLDIMDKTVLLQQFIGNTNYQYVIFYIAGIIMVDIRKHYIMIQSKKEMSCDTGDFVFDAREAELKLQNIEYYKKTKFRMKQLMFILFCIFGSNVERVI